MFLFKKNVIGLEFHDLIIQFVELKKGNHFELESFNRINIAEGIIENGVIKDSEKLSQNLTALFNSANPKPVDVKNFSFILPSKDVFSHIFKLPAHFSNKDIKKTIPLEAENVIPFSVDDIYWDFQVIEEGSPKEKRSYQYVFFAGIPKAIADQYLNFFKVLNLKPYIFGIHANSLFEALQCEIIGGTNLIIDFDAYGTNYLIIKNGKMKFFLSSSEGSEQFLASLKSTYNITDEELLKQIKAKTLNPEYLKGIKNFIQKKYTEAKFMMEENEAKEDIGEITNVFLTGEYASLPQFLEEAKNYFSQKKIKLGDPKKCILVEDKKFIEKHKKKGGEIPFSVFFINAIGIAKQMFNKKKTINLLPDSFKKSFLRERLEFLMSISSMIFSIILLMMAVFLFFKHDEIQHIRNRLEIEKSRIDNTIYGTRYQEIKEMLSSFNNELEQLSKIDQKMFSIPITIEKLYAVLPKGISLSAITFSDKELSIELNGIAETREDLLALQESLKQSDFVEEVYAPLSNYDEKRNVSFSIEVKLKFSNLPRYGTAV